MALRGYIKVITTNYTETEGEEAHFAALDVQNNNIFELYILYCHFCLYCQAQPETLALRFCPRGVIKPQTL